MVEELVRAWLPRVLTRLRPWLDATYYRAARITQIVLGGCVRLALIALHVWMEGFVCRTTIGASGVARSS